MHARKHVRTIAIGLGAVATVAVFAGTASAYDTVPAQQLSTTSPAPGEKVTETLTDFAPGEEGKTEGFSTPVLLATWTADATGSATVSFTIPLNFESCQHHIVSTGLTSGRTVSTAIAVGGDSGACTAESTGSNAGGSSLPKTGAQVAGIALLGAALIGGGMTLRKRSKANA